MAAYSEPVLLTLLDLMMIIGTVIGVAAVPIMLISRQFRMGARPHSGLQERSR